MSQKTDANESWHGMYRAGERSPDKGCHNLKLDLKSGCSGSQLETK